MRRAGTEGTNDRTRNATYIERLVKAALFASLTAVGAQVAIPVGPVPVTLQMLFVFLAGYLLDVAGAGLSMGLYLLLGAMGLPVFARFSGGFVHLFGPTAGYLWAFPLCALAIACLRRRTGKLFAGLVGLGIVYGLGWTVLALNLRNPSKAFMAGVLPFIVPDVAKLLIALYTSEILSKHMAQVERAVE